ncbi:MAG: rRNA maturation RNase YbeY [Pseudomonadota bacterium]
MNEKKLKKKAKNILSALACPDAELSILIVDDLQIAELNKAYLKKSGPTNVIAFPMQEGEFNAINPALLGDVVISIETANQEALNSDMKLEKRLDELLIHGVLHLLGFDHEKTRGEAKRMEEKAKYLMEILKQKK